MSISTIRPPPIPKGSKFTGFSFFPKYIPSASIKSLTFTKGDTPLSLHITGLEQYTTRPNLQIFIVLSFVNDTGSYISAPYNSDSFFDLNFTPHSFSHTVTSPDSFTPSLIVPISSNESYIPLNINVGFSQEFTAFILIELIAKESDDVHRLGWAFLDYKAPSVSEPIRLRTALKMPKFVHPRETNATKVSVDRYRVDDAPAPMGAYELATKAEDSLHAVFFEWTFTRPLNNTPVKKVVEEIEMMPEVDIIPGAVRGGGSGFIPRDIYGRVFVGKKVTKIQFLKGTSVIGMLTEDGGVLLLDLAAKDFASYRLLNDRKVVGIVAMEERSLGLIYGYGAVEVVKLIKSEGLIIQMRSLQMATSTICTGAVAFFCGTLAIATTSGVSILKEGKTASINIANVLDVTLIDQGEILVLLVSGRVFVVSVKSLEVLNTFDVSGEMAGLCAGFGTTCFVTSKNETVELVREHGVWEIRKFPVAVFANAVAGCGKFVLGDEGGEVVVYQVDRGTSENVALASSAAGVVCWSSDWRLVAIAGSSAELPVTLMTGEEAMARRRSSASSGLATSSLDTMKRDIMLSLGLIGELKCFVLNTQTVL
jgi:hypothetical protein